MRKFILTLAVPVLLSACADKPMAEQGPVVNEETTKSVLEHHLNAFQANDLEATMADYTEESVLITPDKTFTGLAEIRGNFEGAFAVLPKDSTTFNVNKTVVVNDMAYIIWDAVTPTLNFSFGTDTFIVQDGKIVRQTFAGVIIPK